MRRAWLAAFVAACGASRDVPPPIVVVAPPPPPLIADAGTAVPVVVTKSKAKPIGVELGLFEGCALYDDGRVVCFGQGVVEGMPPMDRLHVGFNFACARAKDDHALWCWGENPSGQQPKRKKSPDREPPAKVADGVDDFLTGSGHVCILVAGNVTCFGSNVSGECGKKPDHDASGKWIDVPQGNVVFRGAVRVYGGSESACAVDAKERLFCWGGQDGGYNGHGDTYTPKALEIPSRVRAMSFASGHSCLLAEDGTVHCRGWNPGGQLGGAGRPQKAMDGLGAFDDDFEPSFVKVEELGQGNTSIAASRHETCAVSNGQVSCVGRPDWGRTGTCTFDPVPAPKAYKPPPRPAPPAGFTHARCTARPEPDVIDVVDVAATMGRRCTLHRDGRILCVGERRGAKRSFDAEPRALDLPE